ncbi:MAG: glycosyltransferase family 2 protein [Bacteroidales bacterium]|jgi:glycosyltransferase involved in cell wall biosynthesis
MKVTVIIPVYNTAPYITRCLKSVLDQTYDNLEVLLIDDCGTDNSMELAAGLLAQAGYRDTGGGSMQADSARTFTVLRHPENRGLSAARNTGLKAATGEYVFFLDSDDQLPPKAIENLVRMAELYSHPHMVCGAVDVLPQTDPAQSIHDQVQAYTEGNKKVSRILLSRQIPIMACNKLLLRGFLIANKLQFTKDLIHEDNLWTFQMAPHIHNLAVTRQVTYLYHTNTTGLSRERISTQRIDSIKTILTQQLNELVNERPLRSLQEAYIFFTAAWFLDLLYSQKHHAYYQMRQWTRATLRPLARELRYHTLKNRLLYRALYMPPTVLQTARRLRRSKIS